MCKTDYIVTAHIAELAKKACILLQYIETATVAYVMIISI